MRRLFPPLSSRTLLAAGLAGALLALAGLVFATQAAHTEARERFFEQYNRQQLLVARQTAATIEELFHSFQRDLTLAGRLLRDQDMTLAHAEDISRELDKVYEVAADAPIVEFVAFNSRGTAVGMAPVLDRTTVGHDYSWREYYLWARDEGAPDKVYLSPFMRLQGGRARGSMGLITAEPLYREGRFDGVVALVVNFDELARRHILTLRMGKEGYAWLLDNQNETILVDPRGRVSGQTFEQAFQPRWPRLYAIAKASGRGEPGMDWYDYEDPADPSRQVRKLVGYAPVRVADRLWTLGVCTPTREVEALAGSLLNRQTVLSAISIGATLSGALLLLGLVLTWNRSLSREVSARTRDLSEARQKLESAFGELLSAKKLAALGHLALGLAHEIRNPLSSIRLNVQMIMRKSRAEGSVKESFAIVEEEINRLNRLLNHVMGFARPMPLRLAPASTGELLGKVLSLVRERLDADGIRVECAADDGPRLTCDPEQVHQVLLNLVLNAAEAMADTRGRPRTLTLSAEEEDGVAVIRVGDTGHGLLPEDIEQVFDPFFTTKAKGGGLGLSVAHNIVVRHGGSIQVRSREGEGAVFTVRLPLEGPPDPEGARP